MNALAIIVGALGLLAVVGSWLFWRSVGFAFRANPEGVLWHAVRSAPALHGRWIYLDAGDARVRFLPPIKADDGPSAPSRPQLEDAARAVLLEAARVLEDRGLSVSEILEREGYFPPGRLQIMHGWPACVADIEDAAFGRALPTSLDARAYVARLTDLERGDWLAALECIEAGGTPDLTDDVDAYCRERLSAAEREALRREIELAMACFSSAQGTGA